MTLSNHLKELGAKVKKDGTASYYIYYGVNFTAVFNQEFCESSWWEVNTFDDRTSDKIKKLFDWGGDHENSYERKKDVLWHLYQIDRDWE